MNCCSECSNNDECIWKFPTRAGQSMSLDEAKQAYVEYDREMRYLISVDHALRWAINEIERLYAITGAPEPSAGGTQL